MQGRLKIGSEDDWISVQTEGDRAVCGDASDSTRQTKAGWMHIGESPISVTGTAWHTAFDASIDKERRVIGRQSGSNSRRAEKAETRPGLAAGNGFRAAGVAVAVRSTRHALGSGHWQGVSDTILRLH